jgi:hypothetical protein
MLETSITENQERTISIPVVVQELTRYYTSLWWGSNAEFPLLSPTFSPKEQLEKGIRLDRLVDELFISLRRRYSSGEERMEARNGLVLAAENFARAELGFEDRHIEVIRKHHLAEISAEFAKKARAFDPQITNEDIYQASRNVWSMNFMQILLGLPVELTPAVFAYSMLYPFTDNYLDDPSISPRAKFEFNQRFSQRLAGESTSPSNASEKAIWNLIEMVEGQFNRKVYPLLYESLSAIQEAQTRSLNLIHPDASPFEVDVLGISIEKGGTAVLADGYLVAGNLTAAQREFMFGYGVFTQLMDDQEDVLRDLKAGLNTIFSMTARHWPLDEITNRTFHFSANVLNCMDSFHGPDVLTVKELFSRGLSLILIAAAGRISQHYSRRYLLKLEKYLPFRYKNLDKQKRRLERYKLTLGSLLELGV